MKILVVDDDKLTLEVVAHRLKNEGYEIIISENGYEALSILEKEKIDLIITDVMMPNISGLGLLSLLKQFYFNRIPVIIISSLDKTEVILQSIGLGAVEFLPKPLDFEELVRLLKKYDAPEPVKESS